MKPLRPTLLLDLDNTLIECGAYYLKAKADAAAAIERATGTSAANATTLIDAIDAVAIAGPHGFSRQRLPQTFGRAATTASLMTQERIDLALKRECIEIAESVFSAEYALYPGVKRTLAQLRLMGFQLAITTKGETEVQNYKIDKHDLRTLVDHVFISLTKTVDEQRERLLSIDADWDRSWVIGDSRRDDIAPAIALGLKSILIAPGTNAGWHYSNSSAAEPTAHVEAFRDVRVIVGADAHRAQ